MDTILYSASPLRAFSGLIFMTVFFFVLGLGCAGLILLLSGVVMVITTYRSHPIAVKQLHPQFPHRKRFIEAFHFAGETVQRVGFEILRKEVAHIGVAADRIGEDQLSAL